MSTVYRARHPTHGLAAVKIIPLDPNRSDHAVKGKAVVREMRIHETLKHENVLELIGGEMKEGDGGRWPGGLYLVMALGELCARVPDTCWSDERGADGRRNPPPPRTRRDGERIADGGDLFDKISTSVYNFPSSSHYF